MAFSLLVGACADRDDATLSATSEADVTEVVEPTPFTPSPARLARLTRRQYIATIHDLFGDGITVSTNLEPDTEQHGLLAVGATVASVSPLGVERYGDAAKSILDQVLSSEEGRSALIICEPTSAGDEACLQEVVAHWGRLIWRRALASEEVDVLVGVGLEAGATLESFDEAVRYAVLGLLQSPHFLYRVERGEDVDGVHRYTNHEMAARLSYALWNTTPDAELRAAADAGELTDDEGLALQVDRLLASDRARMGTRNFFAEWLDLYRLEELNKDPTIFLHFSAELGAAAREETLAMVERLVYDEDADIRQLFHDRTAYVDRRLASIYNVPAAVDDGFGTVVLPEDGPRAGFLGQVSFLALQAHAVSTSPTTRGVFVRERLLCQEIPTPPSNLNTAIPESSSDAVTMKERLVVHMEDPSCNGCHAFTDPVGFGLERFDGIGRFRILDNGGVIDPTGMIDTVYFDGARQLASVISEHPAYTSCVVKTLFTYLTGHVPEAGEAGLVAELTDGFIEDGRRLRGLIRQVVLSPAFRQLVGVTP